MNKIGVTETGDPGYDFSWTSNLYDANVLITKTLSEKFIEELVKDNRKEKIILHITCTGYGGTPMEPGAPTMEETYQLTQKLLKVFPINQVVLRIDPIIPTKDGLQRLTKVLTKFSNLGITRVRISIIDLYYHVKQRFNEATNSGILPKELALDYWSWQAPKDRMLVILYTLNTFKNVYQFETCSEPELIALDREQSEPILNQVGCVSQKDLDILGSNVVMEGSSRQRRTCLCPGNKYQILRKKPGRCPNKCIYCYWKD